MKQIQKYFELTLFLIIIVFIWLFTKSSDRTEMFSFAGLIGISLIIHILSDIRSNLNKK